MSHCSNVRPGDEIELERLMIVGCPQKYQQTIGEPISFSGIGLHTGKTVNVRIRPAPASSGILFVRSDISKSPYIKACPENVVNTQLATTIGKDGITVSTIEHLMCALYAYGVDNAIVEVDAPEVPILDGSALGFTYLLDQAGIVSQKRLKQYLVFTKPMSYREGDRSIKVTPASHLSVHCSISFSHPVIQHQEKTIAFSRDSFEQAIAPARTWGFFKDVNQLKQLGLAQGGSLQNAVVLDDHRVLNPDNLRFQDEFVRHKILDLVGDLAILGVGIVGRITAERSGHDLHCKFAKMIAENPQAYRMVTAAQAQSPLGMQPVGDSIPAKAGAFAG
jgi:UDP-3-O-[3-hydroxymyristoyl] N-acetylglucosamine deacetylase